MLSSNQEDLISPNVNSDLPTLNAIEDKINTLEQFLMNKVSNPSKTSPLNTYNTENFTNQRNNKGFKSKDNLPPLPISRPTINNKKQSIDSNIANINQSTKSNNLLNSQTQNEDQININAHPAQFTNA